MESDQGQKHAGGRPLKFQNVGELQIKIEAYFGDCDPHVAKRKVIREKANNGEFYMAEEQYITDQKPYLITGLARTLDTTRETLRDYESGKYDDAGKSDDENAKFSDTIRAAKLRCEEYAEGHLFTGKNPAGARFSLNVNYGWVDKTEVDNNIHNVKGDLDDLENGRAEVAGEAAKALEEVGNGAAGSETPEQVVATDPPVQDQG